MSAPRVRPSIAIGVSLGFAALAGWQIWHILSTRRADAAEQEHYRALETQRGAHAGRYTATQTPAWPAYRGPDRDGVSPETALLEDWGPEGPPELWRHPIGGGFASFVIDQGRAITIEQRDDLEVVAAYDMGSGEELWTSTWTARFEEQLGGDGPRATPTLDNNRVYALGATGELRCLAAETGELIWRHALLDTFEMENLPWGLSAAPLIVDDLVVVATSGIEGPGLVAYDKLTGEEQWISEWFKQGYTSPQLVTLAGTRQILHYASVELLGLDPSTGDILWRFPWAPRMGISASQPLVIGPERALVSAAYSAGSALVELTEDAGQITATSLWTSDNLRSKFNSPVLHEGTVYGLDEGQLVALDLDTGDERWRGSDVGYGQLMQADGKLIVLGDTGELLLVEAQPDAFRELARHRALGGKTWNVPALSGGRLLIRNEREMVAYDLRDPNP